MHGLALSLSFPWMDRSMNSGHACMHVRYAMPCQQLCMQTYNSTSKWPEPGARRSVLQSPPVAICTLWRGRKGGYALRRYDGHILCRPVFSSASLNKRPYPWPWLCCMRAHLVSLSLSLSVSLSLHGKNTRTTTPAHHRPTELGRCRYSCLPRV
jgi:hypothetical protein